MFSQARILVVVVKRRRRASVLYATCTSSIMTHNATKVMQNFRRQIRSIMGDAQVAYCFYKHEAR